MTRLSIVIPFYNGARWNIHTIKSLENLGLEDTEYIFIDDGSNDNEYQKTCLAILHSPLQGNIRMCCNGENLGVTKSRNRGLKEAKGEYVLVINNDIELPKKVIERMIVGLESGNLLSCPHEIIDNKYYHRENNINGACRMVKKKEWKKIGPIDERLRLFFNDDRLFNRILYDLNGNIDYFEEQIYHYCSQTVSELPNLSIKSGSDQAKYFEICQEKGRYDKRF